MQLKKETIPDKSRYARFDGKALQGSENEKRRNTQTQKCLSLISVRGNNECNGDYLAMHMESSKEQFAFTTFLIVDDPQRFNLVAAKQIDTAKNLIKHNETPDQSQIVVEQNAEGELKNARILGDEWWNKNEQYILSFLPESESSQFKHLVDVNEKISLFNSLAVNYGLNIEFIRWKDWINQSSLKDEKEFNSHLDAFKTVPALQENLKLSADQFVSKRVGAREKSLKQQNENTKEVKSDCVETVKERNCLELEKKIYFDNSSNFLSEESTGVMVAGVEKDYDFLAYAGKQLSVFNASHKHFVVDKKQNKLNWLSVSFQYKKVDKEKEHKLNKSVYLHENTLYRFQFAIMDTKNKLHPDLLRKSAELSGAMLEQMMRNNDPNIEIIRYSDIVESELFKQNKEKIENKIVSDKTFKIVFKAAADAYLKAVTNGGTNHIAEKQAKIYALDAVIEKYAAILTLLMQKKIKNGHVCIDPVALNACREWLNNKPEIGQHNIIYSGSEDSSSESSENVLEHSSASSSPQEPNILRIPHSTLPTVIGKSVHQMLNKDKQVSYNTSVSLTADFATPQINPTVRKHTYQFNLTKITKTQSLKQFTQTPNLSDNNTNSSNVSMFWADDSKKRNISKNTVTTITTPHSPTINDSTTFKT